MSESDQWRTNFRHDGVKLTSYFNEPFIIGDYENNQTEFMHTSHKRWYTITPYPSPKKIFGYTPVSTSSQLFILGGCCDADNNYYSKITLFEDDEWFDYGELNQGRINFMAVPYGSDIAIIGGTSHENQP